MYADFNRRQLADFSVDGAYLLEEGSNAKHIPFLTISNDGTTGTVVVGNGNDNGVWHPMVASEDPGEVHFITHILVKDQDSNVIALKALDPDEQAPATQAPATMVFDIPTGVTELTPYEWCNLHGLWQGPTVSISSNGASKECGISNFPRGAWPSVHADFLRLQNYLFKSTLPFDESNGIKHTPYIALSDDGTASVLVGKSDGPIHPMNGVTDLTSEPHWITEIYVVDQTGAIVEMMTLETEGVDVAKMEFKVAEGTETLQAYAWCNIHGLYVGPEVEVDISTSVTREPTGEPNAGGAVSTTALALAGAAILAVVHL